VLSQLRLKFTYANVMATIAVFIALGGVSYAAVKLPKNSVGSKQLRKNAVTGAKIKAGSVAGSDLATSVRSQLARTGAAGPQGQTGARGPSFGDGRQVPNVNNIPCEEEAVVGSQTLTVAEPSRIWIHGHGVVSDNASDPDDYGLWLRLRDAGNTSTLAVSTRAWDTATATRQTVALSTGGLMLATDDADAAAPAFVAPPGTYVLQLAVNAEGACGGGPFPDFGFNQGSAMGYVLVGAG
jgi:hypothetical protein